MGNYAHIQVECPLCSQTTDAYLPNEGRARSNTPRLKCRRCNEIFTFGIGMAYRPVGLVGTMPDWAAAANREAAASVTMGERLTEGIAGMGVAAMGGVARVSPRFFDGCLFALMAILMGAWTLFLKQEDAGGRRRQMIGWAVIALIVAAVVYLIVRPR